MKKILTTVVLSLALIGSSFAGTLPPPAHKVNPSPAPVTAVTPIRKGPPVHGSVTVHPRLNSGLHCSKFLFFPRHCYTGHRWF